MMSQCPVLTGTPVGSITVVKRKSNLSGPLPMFIVVTGSTKFSPGFTAIADIGLPLESVTDTILSVSSSIWVSRLYSCTTFTVYLPESDTF